ncbi:MAG: hypothetical protein ABSB69_07585 [Solirubrobacteraceae bacterium]
MHVDPDPIFQALRTLWKGDGASGFGIREQPTLMELRHVIARAERDGEANPRESAVAEACKRCILEAANALPSPPPPDRDLACAARIILGLEDGAEHLTFQGRRRMLETRLGITVNQAAHKRGRALTYEEKQLFRIAETLAEAERDCLENPQGSAQHFACTDYNATLTLTADQPVDWRKAFTLVLDQHFELEALRNGATDFLYFTPKLISPRDDKGTASLTRVDPSGPFADPSAVYPEAHDYLPPVYLFAYQDDIERGTPTSLSVRITKTGIVPDEEFWIVNEHFCIDGLSTHDVTLQLQLPTPESPSRVIADESGTSRGYAAPCLVPERKDGFWPSARATGEFLHEFRCSGRQRFTLSCDIDLIDY